MTYCLETWIKGIPKYPKIQCSFSHMKCKAKAKKFVHICQIRTLLCNLEAFPSVFYSVFQNRNLATFLGRLFKIKQRCMFLPTFIQYSAEFEPRDRMLETVFFWGSRSNGFRNQISFGLWKRTKRNSGFEQKTTLRQNKKIIIITKYTKAKI